LLLRECVVCGGALVPGQETRMHRMMMSGKVLGHDFDTRQTRLEKFYSWNLRE
jgi:hypothetical protein